jgi:hypothetical protein
MAIYATFGSLSGNSLTVKAGAVLPIKILGVYSNLSVASSTFLVQRYSGGGAITGGSTVTPFPLREGAAAAGATSKAAATSVTGTANTFTSQGSLAAGSTATWTPPASLIIPAGSSTVFLVTQSSGTATIYFDELEYQTGF